MADKKKEKKAKAPAAKIVKAEDEDAFLREVNTYFDKGYRPIQEMAMFAELDKASGKWRTLYILPLVHFEEYKEFQSIPMAEHGEEERMFG